MRRHIWILVSLFVLLGVLSSYVVAWSCALWSPMTTYELSSKAGNLCYPVKVPESWPAPSKAVYGSGRGVTFHSAYGHFIAREGAFECGLYRFGWPFEVTELESRFALGDDVDFVLEWRGGWNILSEAKWLSALAWRPLPIRPYFQGLVPSIFLYGLLWYGLFATYRAVLRWHRRKNVRCVKCSYNLKGSIDRCPECGYVIQKS